MNKGLKLRLAEYEIVKGKYLLKNTTKLEEEIDRVIKSNMIYETREANYRCKGVVVDIVDIVKEYLNTAFQDGRDNPGIIDEIRVTKKSTAARKEEAEWANFWVAGEWSGGHDVAFSCLLSAYIRKCFDVHGAHKG